VGRGVLRGTGLCCAEDIAGVSQQHEQRPAVERQLLAHHGVAELLRGFCEVYHRLAAAVQLPEVSIYASDDLDGLRVVLCIANLVLLVVSHSVALVGRLSCRFRFLTSSTIN
jgi:hypothetical protein